MPLSVGLGHFFRLCPQAKTEIGFIILKTGSHSFIHLFLNLHYRLGLGSGPEVPEEEV